MIEIKGKFGAFALAVTNGHQLLMVTIVTIEDTERFLFCFYK